MLALEPRILHICCPGFTELASRRVSASEPEEVLMFEKPGGEGFKVKGKDLKPLIKTKADKIDLVFISIFAPESGEDFTGQMFFDFKVKNVICVKTENTINSKAAFNFTRLFYRNIFK